MNIPDLIARLKAHHAALGDGRDARSDNERAAWWATTREIAKTISGLQNPDLEKPLRLLAEAEANRAAYLVKEASIEQEIADAPDWRSIADGRQRDREYDRQQALKRQLEMLRAGTLLMAPGVTYEQLGVVNARIAELNTKIASLRARLASHVEAAERLLGAVMKDATAATS